MFFQELIVLKILSSFISTLNLGIQIIRIILFNMMVTSFVTINHNLNNKAKNSLKTVTLFFNPLPEYPHNRNHRTPRHRSLHHHNNPLHHNIVPRYPPGYFQATRMGGVGWQTD